jgi:hypothetical protein
MAVSVDNRPTRLRSFLAAVLTVLILVPAGYLFFRVWQSNSDSRDDTKLEQQGVEYLTSLSPLIGALAEAQSSALQGDTAQPATLTASIAGVAAADQRLGSALGTTGRWTDLRTKIGQLPDAGDPISVFQAHVVVSDLALALFTAVRTNSALVRDPDNDVSNLQQAVAVDLPNTVAQVSRMGDLSLMVANVAGSAAQKAQQTALLGPQLGAAVQFVNTSVNALTSDLQAAVDKTGSSTLSGNLVGTLDSFRRGVEALTRGANPGGAPNAATMATAQTQLQSSLGSLSGVVLREMDGLLQDRLDRLDTQRIEAIAAAVLVLLLIIAAILLRPGGRRRGMPPAGGGGETTRDMPLRQPGQQPSYANLIDPSPSYGEADPTRRERSGALR